MDYFSRQQGFSLVEMIVYLSLLVLLLVVGVSSMITLREPLTIYRANQLLYKTADTVLTSINTELRNASSISVPASTLGSSPGTIVMNSDSGTHTVSLVGSSVQYSENSIYVGDLNGTAAAADALSFTHSEHGSTTEMVRTTITLTATIGDVSKSETFYSATVLRDSYE